MSAFDPIKVNGFRALRDHVIITDMKFDQKITSGGIIIPHSDGKLEGIHARWGKVYAIGPEQKDVRPGQYVLVRHGRWTRGLEILDQDGERVIRRIDNKDIMLVSDDAMQDETIGRGL
jgi:co-chaperonin GroES (HSP10)